MGEEEPPPRDEDVGGSDPAPAWNVDRAQSLARLRRGEQTPGGRLVYVDEHGRQRRLTAAELEALDPEERRAAVAALSRALGGPDPDYARLAAVERLTEIRAAGRMSEEDFLRERRRLMGEG